MGRGCAIPTKTWLTAEAEEALAQASTKYHQHWSEEFDRWLDGIDFEGISWTREIRTGLPDAQIVVAAQEHGSDVIVLGAPGRTGLLRTLLGSVTRRVLQQLPCSLLTIKGEDLVSEAHEDELRTVNLLLAEGQALLAAKSYEPAMRKFNQVLARIPTHIPALEGRATTCERLGQNEGAARCRRRADALRSLR